MNRVPAAAIACVLVVIAMPASTAEVVQITWPSGHAAPPARLHGRAAELRPAFRVALGTVPEPAVVALALTQSALLGLPQDVGNRLLPLAAERYRLISESPHYAKALSALPYCYSAERPSQGLASVYLPDAPVKDTRVIVFLHGYGGSFLWYQHLLSESFPDSIIICPAYGIADSLMPLAYVEECLNTVGKRKGFELARPHLLGLPAGGFAACGVYAQQPEAFAQLICIAAYPGDQDLPKIGKGTRVRFVAGAHEPFVASGDFQRRLRVVQSQGADIEAATVRDADHFFLLTHREETMTLLKKWLDAFH